MGNDRIIRAACSSRPLDVKCNFGVCLEKVGGFVSKIKLSSISEKYSSLWKIIGISSS